MTESVHHAASGATDDNRLIAERRAKLARLRDAGPAFPNDFAPDVRAAELHERFDSLDSEQIQATAPGPVRVAGRMMLKRVMGKASFATLQDATGRIQLYVERGALGEEVYAAFKHWDIGDILGV
ncbi:MAG: OB-fold nucleic acid binding domain-containing protein, partial [Pigmentiphaga sp.]